MTQVHYCIAWCDPLRNPQPCKSVWPSKGLKSYSINEEITVMRTTNVVAKREPFWLISNEDTFKRAITMVFI